MPESRGFSKGSAQDPTKPHDNTDKKPSQRTAVRSKRKVKVIGGRQYLVSEDSFEMDENGAVVESNIQHQEVFNCRFCHAFVQDGVDGAIIKRNGSAYCSRHEWLSCWFSLFDFICGVLSSMFK